MKKFYITRPGRSDFGDSQKGDTTETAPIQNLATQHLGGESIFHTTTCGLGPFFHPKRSIKSRKISQNRKKKHVKDNDSLQYHLQNARFVPIVQGNYALKKETGRRPKCFHKQQPVFGPSTPRFEKACVGWYDPLKGTDVMFSCGIGLLILCGAYEGVADASLDREAMNRSVANEAAAPADDKFDLENLVFLMSQGWEQHVGAGLGVWVSVGWQSMFVFQDYQLVWMAPCATAEAGVGATAGSQQTPTGWHRVCEKIGDGAAVGQVFRSRGMTHEVWRPGETTKEDLVLTRVLWLEGLEEGHNKGRNAQGKSVDSRERCIYIHGTNDEARIGTPSSHGCVRLRNADVLAAFEKIPNGTPVLITEE